MITGDIMNIEEIRNVVSGARYIYHFAGIADIAESKARPVDTININILGATNAIQSAVDCDVERFIFASTMYVYSPYGSFYRATKQAAESIIEVYSENFGLDYSFLRYGSLYGERAQEWNGLRGYVQQVIENGSLKYKGTGKEKREYIHVIDAANLSVDILNEKYINKAITVTGNQALYSDELIDLIFEIIGKKKNVDYVDNHKNPDHYLNTPYRYTPKTAIKLVPEQFFDLGQGILEVIEDVSNSNKDS